MKKHICVSLALLIAGTVNAQSLVWAAQMGGSSNEEVFGMKVDPTGSVYVTGEFSGAVDFDPGPDSMFLTSNGLKDIFLARLNPSGGLLWAINIGGTNDDEGKSVALDDEGSVYVTGYFQGMADFKPDSTTFNLTSNGNHDIFICKFNSSGEFKWARQMGGATDDNGNFLSIDGIGNLLVAGNFTGTADLDPDSTILNFTSLGSSDMFITRIDTAGNFIWTKSMGGTNTDELNSVFIDSANEIFLTGHFKGTADFDPDAGILNMTSAGSTDIFVCKLNSTGNVVWAKRLGGSSLDYAFDIETDVNGNVYLTGEFQGTSDFDPGVGVANLTSVGFDDVYICKLNSSGNFVWVKHVGGSSGAFGFSITTDQNGDVYTTGTFYETFDFDPGPGTYNLSSPGCFDTFILKLDAAGNFVWVTDLPGQPINNCGYSVEVDAGGNIYNAGFFASTADFDPGPGNYDLTGFGGWADAYVWKLSNFGVAVSETNETFNIKLFPNPADGFFTVEFDTVQKNTNLKLMTITGQVICSENVTNSKWIRFDLAEPGGIYFLAITDENGRNTILRIIKE